MTAATAGLVVALVFLAVVLLLGLRVLRRGGELDAEGSFLKVFKGKIRLRAPQRERVERDLVEAAEARGQKADLDEGRKRILQARQIRWTRVLWVDDNPDGNLRETLLLLDLGLCVTQATSTDAALGYLERVPFGLVITDLTRDRDVEAGLTLIHRVRRRYPSTPVIVYAFDPGERAARAAELGARAVTTTPSALLSAVLDELGT